MSNDNSRGKAPAFQFYASDFLVDTVSMSDKEVGAYMRLLCYQWVNGGIPTGEQQINRMIDSNINDVWAGIQHKFELCDDNMYRNTKLEQTRQAQASYVKRKSEAGKLAAAKRWEKNTNANALPKNASSSSSSSSTSNTKHKDMSNSNESDFNVFWDLYPRKEAKKKALQAWRKITKENKSLIYVDLKNRYTETEKQFIPLPASYLNGERWNDEVTNTSSEEDYGAGGI